MPLTTSAKKALKQDRKRRIQNLKLIKNMRDSKKDLQKAIEAGKDPKDFLAKAYKAVDKALKSNYYKKNKAARKKSQLAKLVSAK